MYHYCTLLIHEPKILLLILALILTACSSSQVTVTSSVTSSPPTATIIPTPTLHPQFVEFQDQIAAAGGRFTLSSDGGIEDSGDPIPGLHVAADGTVTLIVGGEAVTLASTDLAFDGDELKIKGYELDDNGEWVPAAPDILSTEAGQATMALFTETGIDPDLVELKMDGDSVVCVDKLTQAEACRDGRFDLHWLAPKIPVEKLATINVGPLNWPQRVGQADLPSEYYQSMMNDPKIRAIYPDLQYTLSDLLLHIYGDGTYAWGSILHDKLDIIGRYFTFVNSLCKSVMSHTVIGVCRTVGGRKRAGGEIVL